MFDNTGSEQSCCGTPPTYLTNLILITFQISELTCQVASMEMQMKQGTSSKERISEEIKHLKDLCVKLDNEKDEMKREIRNKEDLKMAVSRTKNYK